MLCQDYKKLFDEASQLLKDPEYFINNYYTELRNMIDLTKEEKIQMIEEKYSNVIKETYDQEKECRLKIAEIEADKLKEIVNVNFINRAKMRALYNSKELKDFEKIRYYFNRYKQDLLLNKEHKFVPSINIINKNNFGDLISTNVEKIDENRSNGIIKFVLNDFSKFKADRKLCFSTEWCIIKNKSWNIYAGIQETKSYNNGLSFFVGLNVSDPLLDYTITYKVVQSNSTLKSKVCLTKTIKHLFSDNNFWGFPEFILLSDIMDVSNGIYDKENDSITLEAHITAN